VDSITVPLPSLTWLLTQAHLSDGARNQQALKEAFVTLSQWVTLSDGEWFPPLILDYDFTTCEVVLNGEWLLPKGFVRLPPPFPRSAIAVQLWMFLCAVPTGPNNKVPNTWDKLALRLGIAAKAVWRIKERISRALAILCDHLHAFSEDQREALRDLKSSIQPPYGYQIIPLKNGKLRFERYDRPRRMRAEFKRATTVEIPTPRIRLTPKRKEHVMPEPDQQPQPIQRAVSQRIQSEEAHRAEVKAWSKKERERERLEREQTPQPQEGPPTVNLRVFVKWFNFAEDRYIRWEVDGLEVTRDKANELFEQHRRGEIKLDPREIVVKTNEEKMASAWASYSGSAHIDLTNEDSPGSYKFADEQLEADREDEGD
jgi:hypothetical protein